MSIISIIDYGAGNLRSIKRGLERVGANVLITDVSKDIINSDAVVLPGVGAFSPAMKNLEPLFQALEQSVNDGKPFLGICLGLQLLFTESYLLRSVGCGSPEQGGGLPVSVLQSSLSTIAGHTKRRFREVPSQIKSYPFVSYCQLFMLVFSLIISKVQRTRPSKLPGL